MSSSRKVRHGHVTRQANAAAAPEPAPAAAEPITAAPVPVADAVAEPAAPSAAPPPPEFTGGPRRSVFDLLKEKYPDLAPASANERSVPHPVLPPKVELPRVEPPKVDARKIENPKVEPSQAEPPKAEPPKAKPPKVEALEVPEVDPLKVAARRPEPARREPESAEKAKIELAETAALASVLALRQGATMPSVEQKATAAPASAAPVEAAPTPAARARATQTRAVLAERFAGWLPRPKVAAFWLSLATLLALGAYGLASLKPSKAPQPEATAITAATVPEDSAAATLSARELTLEPEKVVVKPPGSSAAPAPVSPPQAQPPAKPSPKPPTRAEKREAARKAAAEKKSDSQIVIEQVPPVVPPVRTGGRQPEYPVEARAAGVEGTVVLFGVVDRSGKVKNARVVRGLSPPLDSAALDAFRTWRFKPATQKGKKVDFKYNAGIEFRINSPIEQVAAPQVAEVSLPAGQPAPSLPEPPAASPPPAAGRPLAYGGEFTPPVRITMVWPQKPQGAQMVKGEVKLQLAVGADGNVREVEVLEGLPQGVTEAAIEAVRQWKFKPARQSGEPVAVYHRVSLRF